MKEKSKLNRHRQDRLQLVVLAESYLRHLDTLGLSVDVVRGFEYLEGLEKKDRQILSELLDKFGPVKRLATLTDFLNKMAIQDFWTPMESDKRQWKEVQDAMREMGRILRKAVRRPNLENDPIIREHVAYQRLYKKFFHPLKRDRKDLARGVRSPLPPLTDQEREILYYAAVQRRRGRHLTSVFKEVQRVFGRCGTYEAFRRWLKRHGVSFSD